MVLNERLFFFFLSLKHTIKAPLPCALLEMLKCDLNTAVTEKTSWSSQAVYRSYFDCVIAKPNSDLHFTLAHYQESITYSGFTLCYLSDTQAPANLQWI